MSKLQPKEVIKREWMKDIRKKRKLTVEGIAPMLGISWQHYSDIENGRRNPGIDLSMRLAEFFEVDVQRFFADRVNFKKEEQE